MDPGSGEVIQMSIALGAGAAPALFLYSALLALLSVLCLLSLEVLPRESSDSIIAAVGGLAGGWGVTVFFLMAGYIWKVFTTASMFGSKQRTILPNFALIFGFLAALALIAVFGYLVGSRRRFIWLGAAGAFGFFFGVLLLIFGVRPWETWHL
jgi:hypothetical protein